VGRHRAEISDIIASVRPFTKWAWMPLLLIVPGVAPGLHNRDDAAGGPTSAIPWTTEPGDRVHRGRRP
jgi:hypothetical protein